ncbi:glutathione reductase (NADPH) [Halanaerobium congolense]|jgi:glutathione reductase (NADPH)|uniref:Glutathione reductase (NADPH) n=1 Tax=Halanaerobium congolense TaxID=54121 RepID=A0A1G8T5I6_9FIRM|nr:NAD(P)/FAD-dependent oxidoreductase [Halanaerobium congolense]PUU88878.1 MAG: regulatory protein [Halanaerobium sp.]TDS25960.1 glutathione reductase (NADPH) [Halanaerobium congolense]SDJ36766.1 glutathione reductase (NADPH) [Halanaerobium congolense]SET85754.1 glutathione reductase (NADPH) [Halanaerobium congolense]
MKNYDLFVIGSGMAGMSIAQKAAAKGLKVAITDELPYGGTCALRGCDPKKVLIGPTEDHYHADHLLGKGINQVPEINWEDVMEFKQKFVDEMPPKIEAGYENKGIAMYHENARFLSEDTLQVGQEKIKADKIAIATGAKPRELDFPGAEYAQTSTDFLNMKEMPESLLFIGGGYIAFEFAHIAARCGAEVTIVHRSQAPLKNFEQDIVDHLVKATEELGINLVLETEVCGVEKLEQGYQVKGETNGEFEFFKAEMVINSAGRPPKIFDLDLEKANISYTKKGIEVNEYLQSTTNPRVYAAGDAADSPGLPLTPVGVLEGYTAASNIIKVEQKIVEYPPMPTVVFTLPTMASVGLTEAAAKAGGYNYRVNYKEAENWFNARRLQVPEYAFKTIIDKETETVLGAHLIGPNAEETINLFAMFIKTEIPVTEIKKMIFSYPTLASDISYML